MYDELGRAAVAKSAFKRGEAVLRERPLLVFGGAHPDGAAVAEWAAEARAPEILFSALLAYAAAPKPVRKRVLGMYAGPDGAAGAGGAVGSVAPVSLDAWLQQGPVQRAWAELRARVAKVGEVAARAAPAVRKAKLPPTELATVAAVAVLNQHAYGPGRHALFELGALLAHSVSRHSFGFRGCLHVSPAAAASPIKTPPHSSPQNGDSAGRRRRPG